MVWIILIDVDGKQIDDSLLKEENEESCSLRQIEEQNRITNKKNTETRQFMIQQITTDSVETI